MHLCPGIMWAKHENAVLRLSSFQCAFDAPKDMPGAPRPQGALPEVHAMTEGTTCSTPALLSLGLLASTRWSSLDCSCTHGYAHMQSFARAPPPTWVAASSPSRSNLQRLHPCLVLHPMWRCAPRQTGSCTYSAQRQGEEGPWDCLGQGQQHLACLQNRWTGPPVACGLSSSHKSNTPGRHGSVYGLVLHVSHLWTPRPKPQSCTVSYRLSRFMSQVMYTKP